MRELAGRIVLHRLADLQRAGGGEGVPAGSDLLRHIAGKLQRVPEEPPGVDGVEAGALPLGVDLQSLEAEADLPGVGDGGDPLALELGELGEPTGHLPLGHILGGQQRQRRLQVSALQLPCAAQGGEIGGGEGRADGDVGGEAVEQGLVDVGADGLSRPVPGLTGGLHDERGQGGREGLELSGGRVGLSDLEVGGLAAHGQRIPAVCSQRLQGHGGCGGLGESAPVARGGGVIEAVLRGRHSLLGLAIDPLGAEPHPARERVGGTPDSHDLLGPGPIGALLLRGDGRGGRPLQQTRRRSVGERSRRFEAQDKGPGGPLAVGGEEAGLALAVEAQGIPGAGLHPCLDSEAEVVAEPGVPHIPGLLAPIGRHQGPGVHLHRG